MLREHPLAQPLERETRRGGGQPVVALAKRPQELEVAVRQRLRQLPFQRDEQRPFRRCAPEQHERVVRNPDER